MIHLYLCLLEVHIQDHTRNDISMFYLCSSRAYLPINYMFHVLHYIFLHSRIRLEGKIACMLWSILPTIHGKVFREIILVSKVQYLCLYRLNSLNS